MVFQKKVNDLKDCELEQDFHDLVNTVQQHTTCISAYCSRTSSDETQYRRFQFSFKEYKKKSKRVECVNSKNSFASLRPTLVVKKNKSRNNKHQRLQLQSCRANIAYLEYIAKYASKTEKSHLLLMMHPLRLLKIYKELKILKNLFE